MNIRRSLITTLCTAASLASAAVAGGPVDRPTDPEISNANARPTVYQPSTAGDYSPVNSTVNTQPPPNLRNVPPIAGGYCQLGYRSDGVPPASRNSQAFNCVDNFRPTASTALTQVTWSANFRIGGGTNASPYRGFTAAEEAGFNATENFTIALRLDNTAAPGPGVPVTIPFFTQNVTVTRVKDAVDTVTYPNGSTGGTPNTTFPVYNYTANIIGGPVLTAGTCYWIEIRRTGPAIPAGAVYRWFYAAPGQGDGYSFQKGTADAAFSAFAGLFGFDFAWCINVPCGGPTCPQLATPPVCPYPQTQGGTNTNCQPSRLNKNDSLIIVTSSAFVNVVSGDNFTITNTATQKLNGLCFEGTYTGTTPPTDESYVLRIWKNIPIGPGSPYSFPDTSASGLVAKINLVPSYSIAPPVTATPGAVISLPRQAPQYSFVGTFEWVVNLTNYNQANPSVPLTDGSGGITFPSAGCYWISIQGQSVKDNFRYLLSPFSGPPGGVKGDNFFVAKGTWTSETQPFNVLDQSYGYDLSMCLNFALNTNNQAVCPPVPFAGNSTCATAVPLAVPTAANTLGPQQNLNAGSSLLTGLTAGDIYIPGDENSYGVWYTVMGTGGKVSISTCNSGTPTGGEPNQTNFDTTLYVYCATGSCTGFKFYADNNDDPACTFVDANGDSIGASKVTFPTVSGQLYYVFVTGANTVTVNPAGLAGFFWLSVASAGANDANDPAIACNTIVDPPCQFTIPAVLGPTEQLEVEQCDGTDGMGNFIANEDPCATSSGTTLVTISPLPLGNTVYGFQTNSGFTSDLDYYKLPDRVGDTGYNIEVFAEAPIVVGMYQTVCPFEATPPDAAVQSAFVPGCLKGIAFQTFYSDDQAVTGTMYLFVRPPSAGGLQCTQDVPARNHYKIRVTAAAIGACCVATNTGCNLATRETCTYGQSTDGSFVGVYVGDGTTCSPTPCRTAAGESLSNAAFGSCCLADGTCTVTTQAGCPASPAAAWTVFASQTTALATCVANGSTPSTINCVSSNNVNACCFASDGHCEFLSAAACGAAGGTVKAGGCIPLSCPGAPPATGVCCNGAACLSNVAAATCTGVHKFFVSSTAVCNVAGNFKTPCCKADYTKTGGITVQDIFDYLAAWFAKDISADINGTTPAGGNAAVTVQDIFDFLAAYFAKGCTTP